jgi:hypothetical protein
VIDSEEDWRWLLVHEIMVAAAGAGIKGWRRGAGVRGQSIAP